MTERKRLHLLVEGQTEFIVVQEVLGPHLFQQGWTVTTSVVRTQTTSRTYRGGATSWTKIHRDIKELLGQTSLHVLTTLFDYYAFAEEAPGMTTRPSGSPQERVEHVENQLFRAVGDQRFVPNLVLHELESWVFAAGAELAALRGEDDLADTLERDCERAGGPELVNDGPSTSPSKRLEKYCPTYTKKIDGPLAIELLGVEQLSRRCPRFGAWLNRLDELRTN
ncbi:DUF4276 family protein [Amycolatopsis sp. NPDC049159]|uniref:DUF4276 family protein n=1 Tax=Amycolatopsis sp. NPDC049159 TaxID=3157210 RepID=UPI003407549C